MTKNIIVTAVVALVVSLGVAFVTGSNQSNAPVVSGLSERNVKAITLDVADDVTFRKDVVLKDSTFCIDFYATSTETQAKMLASSTATIEGVDGVITFGYGSCQ